MMPTPTSPSPLPRPAPSAGGASPSPVAAPRWSSAVLLADGREALIDHAGSTYRLRMTALGKLILTK